MEKGSKIKLEDLKVQSLITSLNRDEMKEIQSGFNILMLGITSIRIFC